MMEFGYIEKDWGKSFPKSYTWIQANYFSQKNTCLFFSQATIPFKFMSFDGFICTFILDGKEYRFATYNFAKLKLISLSEIILTKNNLKLIISAIPSDAYTLAAPCAGIMNRSIKECIRANVHVRFYKDNKLIFNETCACGSVEQV